MRIFHCLIRLNLLFFFVLLSIELTGITCIADDAQLSLSAAGQHQGMEHLSTAAEDCEGASVVSDLCQCPCHGSFFYSHRLHVSPLSHVLEELNRPEYHAIKDASPGLFQPPQVS